MKIESYQILYQEIVKKKPILLIKTQKKKQLTCGKMSKDNLKKKTDDVKV